MDQPIRNKLRGVVTQCRRLLEESVRDELQGKFGVYAAPKGDDVQVDADARMTHLDAEERAARTDILDHFAHIKARGFKPKESLDQLVREVAFTHLNRFCAYKMMEARQVYIGDEKFREAVSRGVNSNGVKFYRADHPDDERLFTTGKQDVAYRHFLDWLGGRLSDEIGVLFSPHDPANRLYPPQKVLDEVLALINDEGLADIWTQDETIGWVYQYFTPKELRDQARKESQAPRNSYELAFRNQFFTPRYVVEFLTDNTLGRIWYEMRKGDTKLKGRCRYMVRRPSEVFLADPLAAAERIGFKFEEGKEIPPSVQAAFRGDFASAVTEKDGLLRSWIGLVVPPDQYEAATGHPLRENEDHPSVNEVWSALSEHPDGKLALHPLKIVVALSQLVSTSSGGPYAAQATDQLWAALAATVAAQAEQSDLSQDELLKLPVCVPHRAKKDPRELKILDPASGSGHFLLYCFDLLMLIYEEAYADPDLGPALQRDYPTLDALRRDVPRLILAHNLHGIDIDLRASQIAALALWLRCQRAYQDMGLKKDRPRITRSNFVCAEPMPGEGHMLKEFVGQIEPKLLGQLVEVVFEKMKLAGEAGSLLKIEEEIRDAVADAKQQWVTGPVFVQRSLFDDDAPVLRQRRFDFSGITDAQFFEQAEAKVVEALRNYAEKAQSGQRLQRRLFTDDAVRGFAFVDLCHKRFDVVLMNPPFGSGTAKTRSYIEHVYPASKNDLYCVFVEASLDRLIQGGLVGCITSRMGFFLPAMQAWRERVLLSPTASVQILADLGYGVLDNAFVETAAYTIQRQSASNDAIRCLGLFAVSDKDAGLLTGTQADNCSLLFRNQILAVPGKPFAYWATPRARSTFTRLKSLSDAGVTIAVGLITGDNDRFLRLAWEIPAGSKRWIRYPKGGGYSKYYADIPLLVDWHEDGSVIKSLTAKKHGSASRFVQNTALYLREGLTFPNVSLKGFSVRVLPAGCIFSHVSQGIFSSGANRWLLLGVLSTSVVEHLLRMMSPGRKWHSGFLKSLPFPQIPDSDADRIIAAARTCHEAAFARSSLLETSSHFICPMPSSDDSSLREWSQRTRKNYDAHILSQEQAQRDLDDLSLKAYGLNRKEVTAVDTGLDTESDDSDVDDLDDNESAVVADVHECARLAISYGVGCQFGRWDIRYCTGDKVLPDAPDPFAPLPQFPPGMLRDFDEHLARPGYPISIDSDGILVDDPDHKDDILRRMRDVLEAVWKNRADAIEKEACDTLGVKELREYFRKPGKGGFWDDHVTRYSKSRRKAPIYWLLQSSKKNYAIWLYYHRLDKDLLFKALVNYVEPKSRLEESRLESLRTQKAAAGDSGREAKRLGKDVERQEEFISELRDFEDKLRRAANLHLEPDLNDGVLLNIAPLHELVPWKEAKSYWQELLEGEYEWSSIGKQLRQKELVK